MRGLLLLALLATVVACGSAMSADTAARTSLTITYWPSGQSEGGRVTWTLRCRPARGTAPRPARACRRLAAGAKLFAPVPPDTVCAEIYGGPQSARVVGTVNGRRVSAAFARHNGCEIERWNRLSPWLLPPGGVT
jgi:hypothetical protein